MNKVQCAALVKGKPCQDGAQKGTLFCGPHQNWTPEPKKRSTYMEFAKKPEDGFTLGKAHLQAWLGGAS